MLPRIPVLVLQSTQIYRYSYYSFCGVKCTSGRGMIFFSSLKYRIIGPKCKVAQQGKYIRIVIKYYCRQCTKSHCVFFVERLTAKETCFGWRHANRGIYLLSSKINCWFGVKQLSWNFQIRWPGRSSTSNTGNAFCVVKKSLTMQSQRLCISLCRAHLSFLIYAFRYFRWMDLFGNGMVY